MVYDIVTRLRKQFSNEFVIEHPHMVRVPTLYEQAADEIERLTAERDHWRERCNNAEECLQFINRKKKWWQM